jgi:hypothetical protein
MDCFGGFDSENYHCNRCWLKASCKALREKNDRKQLAAITSPGVEFLTYDGLSLTSKQLSYTLSFVQFTS